MTTTTNEPIDFDTLFRDHGRQVFWAAWRRLENWHDAEDVAQDAFLKAWERRNDYTPRDDKPAQAWVTTLAKWEALSYAHRRFRYVAAGEWADRFAESQPDRDTGTGLPCIADPDTCAGVYAALAQLPDQQRLAVSLYCLSGCDRAEISRCLRLPVHEADTLIRSGMRSLGRRSTPTVPPTPAAVTASSAPVPPRSQNGPTPGTNTPNTTTLQAREIAAAIAENPALADRLTERQRAVVAGLAERNLSRNEAIHFFGVTGFTAVESVVRAAHKRVMCAGDAVSSQLHGGSERRPSPHIERLLTNSELMALRPPRQQEAVRLFYVDGLSLPEIAGRLGTTVGGAKSLLNSAMVGERTRFTGVPRYRGDRHGRRHEGRRARTLAVAL